MGQGLSSLCNTDQSQALKSMYSSPESHPTSLTSSAGHDLGSSGVASTGLTKTEYSADSLSRSYLEQQRAYYESAGLKGYPGYGDTNPVGSSKSGAYTPDSLSGRQSTESPDIKKNPSLTPDPAAQAQALQAYYGMSGGQSMMSGGHGGQVSSLPPLLPMAAQLSQYASSTAAAASAGYSQPTAGGGTAGSGAADYSRRPLSVLF